MTSSTCERFTRIDLRTGKVVGTTQLDLFELASSTLATGIATVGPHTFVGRDTVAGSSISVLDEQGSCGRWSMTMISAWTRTRTWTW